MTKQVVLPPAGLNLLLEMLQSFQHSDFATQFHKTYYLNLLQETFAVMTGDVQFFSSLSSAWCEQDLKPTVTRMFCNRFSSCPLHDVNQRLCTRARACSRWKLTLHLIQPAF